MAYATNELKLEFDGGANPNPGKGYGSYCVCSHEGTYLHRIKFPGQSTNNEAEYRTLICGLEAIVEQLREEGSDPRQFFVDVRGDSKLVILQVLGKWQCKERRMALLRNQARKLLEQFAGWEAKWQPRTKSYQRFGH